MEVIVVENREKASELAAVEVQKLLKKKQDAVLGLPTGETPLFLYKELVARFKRGEIDFTQVKSFNLDEYVGLQKDHPSSYFSYMREHLFNHVNMKEENIHIPNGMSDNIAFECEQYEQKIREKGGIDLQLLGIGHDGHIGFNEPISSLSSRTRIKTLMRDTRKANARFFESEDAVPYHVITMGIQTIMNARACILMAFGEKKANAVALTVEGPISAMCPASVLQMHEHVKIFVDEKAASKLQKINYYKWVYEHKPDWQK